jgi:AraC-like DNA-binding protein
MIDLLGELLLHLKIDATSIGVFHAGERWGISTPPLPPSAFAFHALLDDRAVLRCGDQPDVPLAKGDGILTRAHTSVGFSADARTRLTPFIDIWRKQKLPEDLHARSRRTAPIQYGPDDPDRKPRLLTIAYVLHEPETTPILSMLSDVNVVPATSSSMATWLPAVLDWLAREDLGANPGYVGPGTKMAELILLGFIRDYLLHMPQARRGWLSALKDAKIGKALTAIHATPEKDWTLGLLAAEANMSRASFAARFASMLGKPPMAYLSEERMKQAGVIIASGRKSVAATAEHFGYHSETAFRTAFKKYWGVSPREHGKQRND